MITDQQLIAAGVLPAQARAFVNPLNSACERYAINTPKRQAAFLGQCAHESAGFTRLEESLRYRDPLRLDTLFTAVHGMADAQALIAAGPEAIANRVYAGRLGNGDEASGDGWAFRGRGLLQVTGRSNYAVLRLLVGDGNDYESVPDLLAQPELACLASAAWWASNGCNALADSGFIDSITQKVNGPAMLGAAERRDLTAEFLAVLS